MLASLSVLPPHHPYRETAVLPSAQTSIWVTIMLCIQMKKKIFDYGYYHFTAELYDDTGDQTVNKIIPE